MVSLFVINFEREILKKEVVQKKINEFPNFHRNHQPDNNNKLPIETI